MDILRISRISAYCCFPYIYITNLYILQKTEVLFMQSNTLQDTVSRIFELVDQKYVEQRDFAADLQIAQSVISAWRKRKSVSYNKRLPQIADLLGTTVEYLVTGNLTPPEAPSEEDKSVAKALKLFESLPPDKRPSALEYMEFLLAQGGDREK